MAIIAKSVRITGRVQGVFFRAWTKQQADAQGVRGWVRNRGDGSVEAHLEGDERAVRRLIERLHRGPPAAEVDAVEIAAAEPESAAGFTVRH